LTIETSLFVIKLLLKTQTTLLQ